MMPSLKLDNRNENMQLELNRAVLNKYGNNIVISNLKETSLNKFNVQFDYNKIFHIKDEKTNTIFIRKIRFERIFESDLGFNEKLELPLDEINSAIFSEYDLIKNNIIHKVLSKRDLVLSLIQNTHMPMAYMNKFYFLLNQLVINDSFDKKMIEDAISKNDNFEKYVSLIINSGFAEYDVKRNLKPTNKLRLIFKDKKDTKQTVDEILFILIRDHYDYIVYDLRMPILKTFVNIVSCLIYLNEYMKIQNIKMKVEDFYRVYLTFYQKVNYDKFLERVNNLVYSKVIDSNKGFVTLTTKN